jgi:DNA-binding Lrp family transcriptional regulator
MSVTIHSKEEKMPRTARIVKITISAMATKPTTFLIIILLIGLGLSVMLITIICCTHVIKGYSAPKASRTTHLKYSAKPIICRKVTLMKDIELKVIVELMKNSHRSDRELARAIGVSQPTLSRTRNKLEQQGIIKEYTVIPDCLQLGLMLLSITFTKMKGPLSKEILDDLKKRVRDTMTEHPSALILGNTGMGCNADYVAIAFHKDYGEYTKFMRDIREFPSVNIDETKSFIVDLNEKNQAQPLSFSHLAGYLAKAKESSQTKQKRRNVAPKTYA